MTQAIPYSAVLAICPACGSLFNPPTTASNYRRPGQGFPPAVVDLLNGRLSPPGVSGLCITSS